MEDGHQPRGDALPGGETRRPREDFAMDRRSPAHVGSLWRRSSGPGGALAAPAGRGSPRRPLPRCPGHSLSGPHVELGRGDF